MDIIFMQLILVVDQMYRLCDPCRERRVQTLELQLVVAVERTRLQLQLWQSALHQQLLQLSADVLLGAVAAQVVVVVSTVTAAQIIITLAAVATMHLSNPTVEHQAPVTVPAY
jgi:hypothetical protein